MQLLDGKHISDVIQQEITEEVKAIVEKGGKAPHLAAVLVGNDGASETYVKSKIKACNRIGFQSTLCRFDENISETELLDKIKELNEDESIHGILVQLPLPNHISVNKVIEFIDPLKDVDGFHPVNVGNMVKNLPGFLPATPYGILMLLERYKIETEGKHCVVIGRSDIVGKPMSILLGRNKYPGNATVTVCHSKTKNLKDITLQADIIVAALGKAEFLKGDMIKEGAVVIDVGITRVEDVTKASGFALKGDVDFTDASKKCSYITPVPGGVGPMTIAGLLKNTLRAAKRK